MAKDTFARTKPHWSLANSMGSQWMQEIKEVNDLDAPKVLETVTWTKGKSYPLRAVLDAEASEDNEDGTYAVGIEFDPADGNLAATPGDEIWVVMYNHTTKYIETKITANTRADGLALVNINIPPAGTTYIAFYAASTDGKDVSTEKAILTLTNAGVLAPIE